MSEASRVSGRRASHEAELVAENDMREQQREHARRRSR